MLSIGAHLWLLKTHLHDKNNDNRGLMMVSGFNASCASGKTKLPEVALNYSPRDKAAHIGQPGTRLEPLYHFCKSFQSYLST